jgi:hypothetical protein
MVFLTATAGQALAGPGLTSTAHAVLLNTLFPRRISWGPKELERRLVMAGD